MKLKEIVCAKTSDASRVGLSEYFEVSAFRGNLRDQVNYVSRLGICTLSSVRGTSDGYDNSVSGSLFDTAKQAGVVGPGGTGHHSSSTSLCRSQQTNCLS